MRKVLTFLAVLLIWQGITVAVYGDDANTSIEQSPVKAAIIPCKGLIDSGLYESIVRRSELALEEGATYLIYEMQTYGGFVASADEISKYLILDIGKKARTVAYVSTEAISAGALISVSCQDIIMLENTTIGDSAPITMGGQLEGVEREKQETFVRAAFRRAAEANNYPVDLLEAMVTMRIAVYRVQNIETGEYEFFTEERLPADPNIYDLETRELIVSKEEILTLTASKAELYGVARKVVASLDEALAFLSERDGVQLEGETKVYPLLWSEEMVRWVNSPAVMSVLVLLALLGAYIELNSPGVGLPGLTALICVIIIVGSKYLVGMANWLEIAMLALGVALLLIEIFVIPGFGIAGIFGIMFIIGGIFGMLVKNPPDRIPWPQSQFEWELFTHGLLGLVIGFGGFLILAVLLSRIMPRTKLASSLMLRPTPSKTGNEYEINVTSPQQVDGGVKRGDTGKVVSRLRPAGKVKFGDAIVDVVSRGEFIDIGTDVQIVELRGNRVVVTEIEKGQS